MITTEQVQLKKNEMVTGNISNLNNKVNRLLNVKNNSDQVFTLVEENKEITAVTPYTVSTNKIKVVNNDPRHQTYANISYDFEDRNRRTIQDIIVGKARIGRASVTDVDSKPVFGYRIAIPEGDMYFDYDHGISFNTDYAGYHDQVGERHYTDGALQYVDHPKSKLTGVIKNTFNSHQIGYYTDEQKDTLVPSYLYAENNYCKKNDIDPTIKDINKTISELNQTYVLKTEISTLVGRQIYKSYNFFISGVQSDGKTVFLFRSRDAGPSIYNIFMDDYEGIADISQFPGFRINFDGFSTQNSLKYIKINFTINLEIFKGVGLSDEQFKECFENLSLLVIPNPTEKKYEHCCIHKRIYRALNIEGTTQKKIFFVITGEYFGQIFFENYSNPFIQFIFVTSFPYSGKPGFEKDSHLELLTNGIMDENSASFEIIDSIS